MFHSKLPMMYRLFSNRPIGLIFVAAIFLVLSSCKKCEDIPIISYFAFEDLSPVAIGKIDHSTHAIIVEVPVSTDVTNLTPTINVGSSDCLMLSPLSGTRQDFSTSVAYEVSNENEDMVQYEVTVKVEEPEGEDSTLLINWSTGSDMPTAVAWSSGAMLENKYYVIGGVDVSGVTNVVQQYDPVTDTWNEDVAGLQKKRWGHSASVVGGKIYVMGGTDVAKGDALTSIEVYDPKTGSWEYEGEMTMGRIGHRAVAYEGKIYVIGGELKEPSPGTLDDVEVYDPVALSWETLSPMPTSRQFPAISLIGDVIYVLGGGVSYPYPGSTAVEAYNINEDSWEVKPDLKVGLLDNNACEIDGKIISAGGLVLWAMGAIADVQVYDPATSQAFLASELQYARGASVVFAYQGNIYVCGGHVTLQPDFTCSSKLEIGIPDF
jgi:hypothetical protein